MSLIAAPALMSGPDDDRGFRLFEPYRGFLMKVAHTRMGCQSVGPKDASDFVQETILAAVVAERRGCGPNPTDADRERWLGRILMNKINAAFRHEAILILGSHTGQDPSDPGTPPPDRAINGENARRLAVALERLSPEDRMLVELSMDGVSRREVGERLGVSASYASQISKRALQRLREAYAESGEDSTL